MEDRSALFNQLKDFSQRKLKKVETKVVTGTGELLVEKRGAKGLQVLSGDKAAGDGAASQEPARKLDLQVAFILPGLLLGSQDVAHDKSSLESYGITHILNLDRDVENKFEEDYNYKNVAIQDKADFELDKILDECFDFIDDGRHYGNVFVHCSGTIGLSRSTSVCVAYLMNKEKQAFNEAFNNVKEVRSFVKPNEGFVKQLKDYEVKLRGAQAVKESGIDDPFALRKKQEIEQEKAMVAGAASVKNRMKMFGANLEAGSPPPPGGRSKSASPSPYKQQQTPTPATTNQNSANASKWSSQNASSATADKLGSKSMTPEPRKSWQQPQQPAGPPPPPPPMPSSSLFGNDKSIKPTSSNSSSKSSLPPPPPPPPPKGDLSQDKPSSIKSRYQPSAANTTTTTNTTTTSKPPETSGQRKGSVSETSEDETGGAKRVFGRRPPPPMKIRGGLSIERQDSVSSDKQSEPPAKGRSTQQLRLETANCDRVRNGLGRNAASSQCLTATLESANQPPNAAAAAGAHSGFGQRCPSPLVLMNNVSPVQSRDRPQRMVNDGESGVQDQLLENPFSYWQRTLASKGSESAGVLPGAGQAPKRTASLGPKRSRQIGAGLQKNPFLSGGAESPGVDRAAAVERRGSFTRAARELQSSLTELNNLIDSSPEVMRPVGRQQNNSSRPPLAGPPLPSRPASSRAPLLVYNNEGPALVQPPRCSSTSDEPENREQRFMWQEDLANWKSSNSVNDLLSVFESAKSAATATLPPPPTSSGSMRPRLNSTSVLKRTPWQDMNQSGSPSPQPNQAAEADYTIRRTTSTSSSLKTRPVLRNPYRTQYG